MSSISTGLICGYSIAQYSMTYNLRCGVQLSIGAVQSAGAYSNSFTRAAAFKKQTGQVRIRRAGADSGWYTAQIVHKALNVFTGDICEPRELPYCWSLVSDIVDGRNGFIFMKSILTVRLVAAASGRNMLMTGKDCVNSKLARPLAVPLWLVLVVILLCTSRSEPIAKVV
jgi:hypothetical protein